MNALTGLTAQLANSIPVILAIIGVIGAVVAAKVIKPPTYSELVSENRALRGEREALDGRVDRLRDDLDAFKAKHDRERDVLSRGFDALYRKTERQKTAWGTGALPVTDAIDRAAITAALALRTAGTS